MSFCPHYCRGPVVEQLYNTECREVPLTSLGLRFTYTSPIFAAFLSLVVHVYHSFAGVRAIHRIRQSSPTQFFVRSCQR